MKKNKNEYPLDDEVDEDVAPPDKFENLIKFVKLLSEKDLPSEEKNDIVES